MYKIYLDNRFIILSSQPDHRQNYCLLHKYNNQEALSEQISAFLSDESINFLNIYSADIESLWQSFKEIFHFLEASGGIVKDNKGNLLLIKRYKRWDAPKGHFEPCETPELCARREIKEECGIVCGNTIAELSPTYHVYKFREEYYLKKTYWFLFDYSGNGKTIPQQEEGITQADWIKRDSIDDIIKDMWHSIRDVLSEVIEKHISYK